MPSASDVDQVEVEEVVRGPLHLDRRDVVVADLDVDVTDVGPMDDVDGHDRRPGRARFVRTTSWWCLTGVDHEVEPGNRCPPGRVE